MAHLPSRNVIADLHIERGYIGSTLVQDVLDARREGLCKPCGVQGSRKCLGPGVRNAARRKHYQDEQELGRGCVGKE
jgi:hypothetical protein